MMPRDQGYWFALLLVPALLLEDERSTKSGWVQTSVRESGEQCLMPCVGWGEVAVVARLALSPCRYRAAGPTRI
jgi:hypothetical protein